MPRRELTPLNLTRWTYLLKQISYPCALSARILEGIERGADIGFVGVRERPAAERSCVNSASVRDDARAEALVNAIIVADVASGKKAGPFDEEPFPHFCCSPIGAVPKGESGVRVIHNLSYPFGGNSINYNIEDEYAPLGRLDDACRYIRTLGAGCYLVKIDVKAAYKLVPVRFEDWPLIGFMWRGQYYYERTLPFGLKSSCAIWELYSTAMQAFIERIIGIKYVVHYIDDFLFVIQLRAPAAAQLAAVLELCEGAGVPISPEKTEGPVTRLTFLGVELDTVAMTARLSEVKLDELRSLLITWENKSHATKRELQSLTGKLQWACQVVRPGRSFLRRIIDFTTTLAEAPRTARDGEMQSHRITDDVRLDIAWWREFAPTFNGHSMLHDAYWEEAPLIEIYTDACEQGYGAKFGARWIKGRWSSAQLAVARNHSRGDKVSMPYLELLALLLAVATWAPLWANTRITLRIDCMPVVQAVERRASSIPRSMALIRLLHTLCARHSCDVRPVHVAGVLNVSADALSRDQEGDMQRFRTDSPDANELQDATGKLPPQHTL